jgi:hypothetical protein
MLGAREDILELGNRLDSEKVDWEEDVEVKMRMLRFEDCLWSLGYEFVSMVS